jgi:hypothetical protein
MYNAGVRIFQDDKPIVFDVPSQSDSPVITTPCFYSSREQKGDDEKSNAIRGSRAVGTLFTPANAFVVYNTGNSIINWSEKLELRYKGEINYTLLNSKIISGYRPLHVGGIMLGAGMASLAQYL